MADRDQLLSDVERDFESRAQIASLPELSERLNQLSIGIPQRIPVLFAGTRMFRVRRLPTKPSSIDDVGAPPASAVPIGRLNEAGQSVLYLADSPSTAFAEARVGEGAFCLSEWRVTAEKLGTANGGFTAAMLAECRDIYQGKEPLPTPTEQDERVLRLFRRIYTLDVGEDTQRYRWSIACGLANGFCHACDRQASRTEGDFTHWTGRYPFSGITYPSVRTDRRGVNYALNDLGRTHVRLRHVQWVRGAADGSYASLDFADSWTEQGISWQGRPAKIQLQPGKSAKLTKVAADTWRCEMADGSVPEFV